MIAPDGGWQRGSPCLFETTADRRLAAVAWSATLALSFVLIALLQFRSGDPDSNVYAGISARLATEPFARWIAPEWWGQWSFTGPFREHPIGIFILPALAGRAGYPPPQAAYAVNGLFQVMCIVLAQLIAAHVARGREARALGWIVQLMPIAFVFRIRANQEYAVLTGILLALLATERSRRRPRWAWLTALGFAWALLVKGVFGFVVPIACALWLAVAGWREADAAGGAAADSTGADGDRLTTARDVGAAPQVRSRDGAPTFQSPPTRRLVPWIALALVLLVAPLLTIAYEWAYRTVAGDSFLAFYTGPRLRPDAVAGGALNRAGYNIVWYTARLAWYAFPWSLVALGAFGAWAAGVRSRGRDAAMTRAGGAAGQTPSAGTPSVGGGAGAPIRADTDAISGLLFAVVASFALIVLFSLSDRKADRFIFPAYYLMAAAGGVAAIRCSPMLSRIVDRLDRPWVPAACWLTLFLLRLATGSHLPQFTFWRS